MGLLYVQEHVVQFAFGRRLVTVSFHVAAFYLKGVLIKCLLTGKLGVGGENKSF